MTPAIVELQGDVSNITGIANLAPGQAYSFAPTVDTPDMSIGFDIGGAVDVIIDALVDGSVELAGGNSYTGATRIVRGALRIGGGALDGDFDGNGEVNGFDFLLWQRDPSVGSLAAWEANYGTVALLSASSAAVPEPTTSALALAALCLAMSRRRAT